MKKVVTYFECDRCGFDQLVECKKSILGYRAARIPQDWKTVENDLLCPKCRKDWYDTYNKFMGSKKTKKTGGKTK
jgi:hypothetical protein